MKRTKLSEIKLPQYTKGEEIFNMVSHIVGAAIGLVAIVLCCVFAAIKGDVYAVVSGAIFGSTMLLLYTMSSIYHGLKPESMAKRVFQIIDHCSIFILIAGTYTPIALCTIRAVDAEEGWLLFGIIWAIAIFGIVINSIDLKKFKVISMILYLVMGWLIIAKLDLLIDAVGMNAFILLLAGGISYTIGALFYGFAKTKWMHSVFHIFCVIASILHFLCILIYVVS